MTVTPLPKPAEDPGAPLSQKIRERLITAGGELLEVDPADLVLGDGKVWPRGAPERAVTISKIVTWIDATAGTLGRGLHEEVEFKTETPSYPFGTTIAVVAIDPGTGSIRIERLVSVDDVGNVVKLANWTDERRTTLAPHPPEPTPTVVEIGALNWEDEEEADEKN